MSHTIDSEKLAEVTRIFNQETDPKATEDLVESEICADWNEGDEHQDWINRASPQEIADWLAMFYMSEEDFYAGQEEADAVDWQAEIIEEEGL